MRAALRIVAVNLAVLAAGILIVELTFGAWVFGPDYREMNIPRNSVRVFDVEGCMPVAAGLPTHVMSTGCVGHTKASAASTS